MQRWKPWQTGPHGTGKHKLWWGTKQNPTSTGTFGGALTSKDTRVGTAEAWGGDGGWGDLRWLSWPEPNNCNCN